ncbi:TetR family transcriptional regulator [Neisseria montereyensis]|uniref:TetR family transcriptional regulator n=1 Tax=Neisseria montereyensis TaxID=2973938 RepID=A0ABT2FAN9_9NEIS|nr:TetR family transcriptional regulator [Neisseria montereyensis]MCS4533227.1 TetR family transcriptional regulator [Neisseria montereyensis]
MRRTKAEALETRQNLLMAALETFYHKGTSRASLNEIARAAGVTRGALYWHFKNKEDLFDALFGQLWEDAENQLRNDLADGAADMLESLYNSLLAMFDRLANDPLYYKFYSVLFLKCEYVTENQAIVDVIVKYEKMWYELLTAVFQQCVKQKSLPENLDIDAAVFYFQSAITGSIYQNLVNPVRADIKRDMLLVFVKSIIGGLQYCPTLRSPEDNPVSE